MEIIENFHEIIAHYDSKISYAQEELMQTSRKLVEQLPTIEIGWRGQAADELKVKLEELKVALREPGYQMDATRSSLAALGLAMEEDLRRKIAELEAEKQAAAEAAEAAASQSTKEVRWEKAD